MTYFFLTLLIITIFDVMNVCIYDVNVMIVSVCVYADCSDKVQKIRNDADMWLVLLVGPKTLITRSKPRIFIIFFKIKTT